MKPITHFTNEHRIMHPFRTYIMVMDAMDKDMAKALRTTALVGGLVIKADMEGEKIERPEQLPEQLVQSAAVTLEAADKKGVKPQALATFVESYGSMVVASINALKQYRDTQQSKSGTVH